MNAQAQIIASEPTALDITRDGIIAALSVSPRRSDGWLMVEDETSGDTIGWIKKHKSGWTIWQCTHEHGSQGGSEPTRVEALGKMAIAAELHRSYEAMARLRRTEVESLPKPVRSLTIARNAAAVQVMIEENRNVRRPADLNRARECLRSAELDLAAAERGMAEAA